MNTFKKIATLCAIALATVATHAQSNQSASEPSDFSYGIYGGAGAAFPTAGVADNFKGSALFQIGLTGAYQNLRLKTDVAFGQPSFKNRNIFARYDDAGHPTQDNSNADASLLLWTVQAGYRVYHGHRLSVTPNVGFVMSRYGWDVNNLEWSKDKDGEDQFQVTSSEKVNCKNWNWMVSIDFDIRLHTTVPGQRQQALHLVNPRHPLRGGCETQQDRAVCPRMSGGSHGELSGPTPVARLLIYLF